MSPDEVNANVPVLFSGPIDPRIRQAFGSDEDDGNINARVGFKAL